VPTFWARCLFTPFQSWVYFPFVLPFFPSKKVGFSPFFSHTDAGEWFFSRCLPFFNHPFLLSLGQRFSPSLFFFGSDGGSSRFCFNSLPRPFSGYPFFRAVSDPLFATHYILFFFMVFPGFNSPRSFPSLNFLFPSSPPVTWILPFDVFCL